MTVGTYSFAGKSVVQPVKFEPIPRGIYNMVLKTKGAEIRKKDEPGKAARINIRLTSTDQTDEQGRPLSCFHEFHLGLKKGKDGSVMPEKADGLLGLATALGEELPDIALVQMKDVGGGTFMQLSAIAVQKWLQGVDGQEVTVEIDIEPAKGEYRARNRVISFANINGETAEESGESSQEAVEEEAAEEVTEEVQEEEVTEYVEEEEELAPPPKKAAPKKATPAPVNKPAPKPAAKKGR